MGLENRGTGGGLYGSSGYTLLTLCLQVLDLSSTGGNKLVERDTKVTFLDEFRMILLTPDRAANSPELILFNTLLPQDHPGNSRRLSLPPRYRNWSPSLGYDSNRPLGTLNWDGPLIIDPSQAVLVVEFSDGNLRNVLIILRMQVLIDHSCSTSADAHIPWNEWGRSAVVMEMPTGDDSDVGIHGFHVIAMGVDNSSGGGEQHQLLLRIFDFSRRGCSTLRDEGGGVERTVSYEGEREILLEEGENEAVDWVVNSGDGNFFHLVSCPCH
jgi:hypothetical protein